MFFFFQSVYRKRTRCGLHTLLYCFSFFCVCFIAYVMDPIGSDWTGVGSDLTDLTDWVTDWEREYIAHTASHCRLLSSA